MTLTPILLSFSSFFFLTAPITFTFLSQCFGLNKTLHVIHLADHQEHVAQAH